MFVTFQAAGKPTSKVPISRLIFALTQERSLSAVAGMAAIRNLLVQMNSLATAELTPGRRSLCALCVIGVSCAATT